MTDPIRMIRLREELRERLRCHLPGPGIHPTAIEGLNLVLMVKVSWSPWICPSSPM